MSAKSLDQWLAEIEAKHPQEIDLGLERVRHIAHRLKLTSLTVPVITVAGTNGKGSTIAYLTSILSTAGYRVGAYTSPHFLHYNERVCVNAQPVEDLLFCQAFAAIDQACQDLDISLTYFEYGTLAAFWIFQHLVDKRQLDVALLEVGLGGRLDAVNVVDPNIAIVTTVALDHQSWLGSNREEIGVEKAGIYRQNAPAIYGEADMPSTVQEKIDVLKAERFQLSKEYKALTNEDTWTWQGKSFTGSVIELTDLPFPSLPFDNASTALQALQLLNLPITAEEYQQGLAKAELTGRFQTLTYQGRTILLDVAHNPHAAKHLSDQLANQSRQSIHAVVGMLSDKDVKGTLEPLSDRISHWYIGTLNEPRGLTSSMLKDLAPNLTMQPFDSVTMAFETALKESNESDLIVVMGSFFTVAEVLSNIQAKGEMH